MNDIFVNNEGYKQFLDEFEKLNNSLTTNATNGSEAYADAVGDGWHDNFAYEEAMRQERMIQTKIAEMIKKKDLLKIVPEEEYSDDLVFINDTVEVLIKYDEDDEEIEIVKLTGKYLPDSSLNEISLNSPIGHAIYKQKVGSSTFYEVNNKKIEVHIIRKVK